MLLEWWMDPCIYTRFTWKHIWDMFYIHHEQMFENCKKNIEIKLQKMHMDFKDCKICCFWSIQPCHTYPNRQLLFIWIKHLLLVWQNKWTHFMTLISKVTKVKVAKVLGRCKVNYSRIFLKGPPRWGFIQGSKNQFQNNGIRVVEGPVGCPMTNQGK